MMDKSPALQEAQSSTLDLERTTVKRLKDPPLTTGRMLPDGTYAMVVQPADYAHRWCASLAAEARKRRLGKEAKRRALERRAKSPTRPAGATNNCNCNRKPESRRKNVSFKDLDDAILGLTNCKGRQNFPKSKSMFLVTYRLFKDQKLAVSGTSSCQGSCKHRNTRSARTLCPRSMKDQTKLRTWRSDVKNGIAPTMHTNAWKCFKDEQYCNVVLGRKTGTSPTRIRLCTDCTWCTDRKAKAFKGWGYGKVDGRWYEIYSKYQCGIHSKITSCEIIGKTPRCQVRKQCGSFSKVSFYSVWAIPKYPSSAGAYRKYRIAPKWFVDKALSSTHGKMGSSFQKKCRQRCAWY